MKRSILIILALACALALCLTALPVQAQQKDATVSGDDSEELAKKLQNPVASLISVPMQSNWDFGSGATNAMRYTLNVQPVIPFSLNQEWNLITRTIVPVIHAESLVPSGSTRSGLGDITQSFFFSPSKPIDGWIVGAGPVFLYPSATDKALGGEKWGAGRP